MCCLLILPACGTLSKKIKKSDRYAEHNDSTFLPVSEDEIRDAVRQQYSTQQEDLVAVIPPKKMSRKQKKRFISNRVEEKEAKLIDIPLLLNAQPIERFFLDEEGEIPHTELGYSVSLSPEELIDFFNKGMECHGWRKTLELSGSENFILFSKPDRFCFVSIRPQGLVCNVVLCVGNF